jgi:hypothetical protein
MSNKKTSEYVNDATSFNDNDLFDVSEYVSPSFWQTAKYTWLVLTNNIASKLGFASKNKLNGSAAPTATDDSAAGYSIGSLWGWNGNTYICKDATIGAAVWTQQNTGGGGGAVDSVNGQTGVVVLDTDDISDASTTNKFTNTTEKGTWNAKLDSVVAGTNITVDNTDPQNPIINASGGSATWGGIAGTLSDQTDLQSALDTKVDESRTLTINGTGYDLSANRSWTVTAGAPTAIAGIRTETASYTPVIGDAGYLTRMNVGSANTFTVPPNSSVAYAIGTYLYVSQKGAGQTSIVAGSEVTIGAGSGVRINSVGSWLKLAAQYSHVVLIKVDTNEWNLTGQLVP